MKIHPGNVLIIYSRSSKIPVHHIYNFQTKLGTELMHDLEVVLVKLTEGTRCRIASPSKQPTERANKKDRRYAFFLVPEILMKIAPSTEAKLRNTMQSVPIP